VEIRFYATLRQITGRKTVRFDLEDGCTVREMIEKVVSRFPAMRAELLDEHGALHGHVHIFINGRDVPYLKDVLETRLHPDDKVDIFPAVGGG
jgi:MoaD family protein